MIDFLAKVLGPVFVNYGVSEADFQAYLTQLSGYVYFTLALLAVLVIVLVLAQKAKKGFRHVVRWQAVLAFVAIGDGQYDLLRPNVQQRVRFSECVEGRPV